MPARIHLVHKEHHILWAWQWPAAGPATKCRWRWHGLARLCRVSAKLQVCTLFHAVWTALDMIVLPVTGKVLRLHVLLLAQHRVANNSWHSMPSMHALTEHASVRTSSR